MDLGTQLHLAAGLGAMGLGVAALVRDPKRHRNRLFAVLCAGLTVWNLGVAGAAAGLGNGFPWRPLFLLGSCAAAPVGLHFVLVIAGRPPTRRRPLVWMAYTAAVVLWLSSWKFDQFQPVWNLTALAVLGTILLVAVVILAPHALSLPRGAERRAWRLVLVASALAVVGGMSDFLPRGETDVVKLGPVFMLVFLLVVCSVVVRHRFLDVDVFLARSVAVMVGAVGAAFALLVVIRLFGARFLPLFVTCLVLLGVMRPLVRLMFSTARGFLGGDDRVAEALVATSQELPLSRSADQIWKAIDDGRRSLPGNVHLVVYLLRETEGFVSAYSAGETVAAPGVPTGSALPLLLADERSPITRRFLDVESRESVPGRRGAAARAVEQLDGMDAELVVPLLGGDRLLGWIAVGGGNPDRYLRGQVAAAFMAVGNQAVASLERIEAQAQARRRETLAAVGEMAAGLAHEVRNPVAAIRGAAQAISPDATPEQSREMLEVIEEETERLGRFVGEFLDYARPSSPRRDRIDLGELARRVERGANLSGTGLRVEIVAAPSLPAVVGDPDQIQRAFENLVRNAAEATGAGGTLRVHLGTGTAGTAEVRFEDNGPGIPDEILPGLFQPFHTTKPGGTGLGLALVHRIVESHGGSIRVEGRPGVGALFVIELPAAGATGSGQPG